MSKKVISKVKRPHQKCSHRSSSVGNESCIRDDEDFSYKTVVKCYDDSPINEVQNSNYSHNNLEHQLRRLELINDNLYKHLRRIQGNSSMNNNNNNTNNACDNTDNDNSTTSESTNITRLQRQPVSSGHGLYEDKLMKLPPPPHPLSSDLFGDIKWTNNTTGAYHHYNQHSPYLYDDEKHHQPLSRHHQHKHYDYQYQPVETFSHATPSLRHPITKYGLLYNPPKGYTDQLYDVNDAVKTPNTATNTRNLNDTSKCTGSSLTFFATPYLKKTNALQNDRVSNSSDTSRHSSASSQNLRVGIDLFNRHPDSGIEYFRTNCFVDSDDDLVDLLIRKKGFSKMKIFEYLNRKENKTIHRGFCQHLDLKLKTIPEAIKEYMKYSFITGEYSTMLNIIEVLSEAYAYQHPEGVMGLTNEQLTTIMQFLLAFHANESYDKRSQMGRERFIELLQQSMPNERSQINRQLASCLYLEITESPLQPSMDDKLQTLLSVQKQLADIPRDFSLSQHHRYVICHVDLHLVNLPPVTTEKPSYRDRTVFLFNDLLIVAKKQWSYDNRSYKVKQIVNLGQITCSLVTRSLSYAFPSGTMKLVQLSNSGNGDVIMSYYSKIEDDLMNFYNTLENTLNIYKSVMENLKLDSAVTSSKNEKRVIDKSG